MIPRLTAALDFQSQALVLRAERQRVIAGNIANADTPGYQARDFDFATALRDATGGVRAGHGIAQGVAGQAGGAAPQLQYRSATQNNLDGNTVDMDRERSAFVDNAVRYETTLRFVTGSLRTLQDAMKSHHQA